MKNIRLFLSLYIIVLGVVLTACNNDIFIEPLNVESDTDVLGPDCRTASIRVSGKNWTVEELWFSSEEGMYHGTMEGESYSFKTPYAELNGHYTSGGIVVNLVSYLGNSDARLGMTICDGYEYIPVEITVRPTAEYSVEILDVDYTLNQWSGYPDKDYTRNVISYRFPEGLAEPREFSFPNIEDMPVDYFFMPWYSDDLFADRVLNSGISVPVPSFVGYAIGHPSAWEMAGEEAPLTTSRSIIFTRFVPTMPAAVTLPAGKPLEVTLFCEYECLGLDCTVRAVNPMTQQPEDVECQLQMMVPVKFISEIKDL